MQYVFIVVMRQLVFGLDPEMGPKWPRTLFLLLGFLLLSHFRSPKALSFLNRS